MLTEPPEIQADTLGPPNITVRQDTPAMEILAITTLPAATNDLATIATHMAAAADVIHVGSRSITKASLGMTPAGAATHTMITTGHRLVARTNTKTAIDRRLGRPTSGLAPEIPCPRVHPPT
jgi:hypothetical protein